MSAASPESTGTSGRPPSGRHRRPGSSALAALAIGVLLMLLVAGAMFSPVLLGWPPPASNAAAAPSTVGTTRTAAPSASASAAPRTSPPVRPPTTRNPPAARPIASFEDEVLALTNATRREEGCPELRMDTRLRDAARRHSAEMARFGYLSHSSRDGSGPLQRIRAAGYSTGGGWAENIARGYPTPSAVMNGWLNSPGHRANILNCSLRALGVGVVRSSGGRVYWTQDFGAR